MCPPLARHSQHHRKGEKIACLVKYNNPICVFGTVTFKRTSEVIFANKASIRILSKKKKKCFSPKCLSLLLELVTSLNKSPHHPKITRWTHPWEGICKISSRGKISPLMLRVSFLKLCNIRQVLSQSCHCYCLNFFGGFFNEKHATFCF